jgi:hypothetical protein
MVKLFFGCAGKNCFWNLKQIKWNCYRQNMQALKVPPYPSFFTIQIIGSPQVFSRRDRREYEKPLMSIGGNLFSSVLKYG